MGYTKKFDACATVGHYTKDGVTKKRYRPVGAVWEGDDGRMFLRLNRDFNPAAGEHKDGDDTTVISFFDPKPKDEGGW